MDLELKAEETLLLPLVLESLGEKGEKEIELNWVLVDDEVGCELRKGNNGDSVAEMESGFIARKSVMVRKSTTPGGAEVDYYLAA